MFSNFLSYHRAFSLPPSNSPRQRKLHRGGEVQSHFSFTLPYKHVWTLSYIYRVLISPIDKSLEQRNNKTKPKHINFPCCELWLCLYAAANLRLAIFSSWPRRGVVLRCSEGSLRSGVGPPKLPRIIDLSPFLFQSPTKMKGYSYILHKNISQVCSNSTKTNDRD